MDWGVNETQPRYQHSAEKVSLSARGINLDKTDVMMSSMCQSSDNHFVGVSMYSPHYKAKAERLLRSCARNGVCCKARLLPPDAFGADAPEGSEDFRFQTIASKPSFILGELEATELPVVFLDTDLEFHSFPNLFVPGSWPNNGAPSLAPRGHRPSPSTCPPHTCSSPATAGRDVAIFNFWGNETDRVVFFNHTRRSKSLLKAWAEAMAWKGNYQAPDDQVLDKLLKEGGWLRRASYGWLPASYLRTMPSYYRGVDPVVIDHDHGSAPGLLKHSERKPDLPPVESYELCDPGRGEPGYVAEPAPRPWSAEEAEENAPGDAPGADEEEAIQMPEGTCESTASRDTPDGTKDQKKGWDGWCDENCIPIAWGGLGKGACGDGSGYGTIGCKCKKGAEPVYVKSGLTVSGYKEALQAEDEEQSEDAETDALTTPASPATPTEPATLEEPVTPAVPKSKCESANSALSPDERAMWSAWCVETCGPPAGKAENCKTPEQTGAAQCTCKSSAGKS